jgi:hypothetical protein
MLAWEGNRPEVKLVVCESEAADTIGKQLLERGGNAVVNASSNHLVRQPGELANRTRGLIQP